MRLSTPSLWHPSTHPVRRRAGLTQPPLVAATLLLFAMTLSGCANRPLASAPASGPERLIARCGSVAFGAVKVGARTSSSKAVDEDIDQLAIVSEGVRGAAISGHGRTGVLDITKKTISVAWWFVGDSTALAPKQDVRRMDAYVVSEPPGDPRSIEVLTKVVVQQRDLERLVCAANRFWASEKLNYQRSPDRTFGAILIDRAMLKETWGFGELKDDAAAFAELFWGLVPPLPSSN